MVLPPTTVSKLALGIPTPGILSVDGHINIDIECGDAVTVKLSSKTLRFLRVHETTFYESLEQRLKGKQPADARRAS